MEYSKTVYECLLQFTLVNRQRFRFIVSGSWSQLCPRCQDSDHPGYPTTSSPLTLSRMYCKFGKSHQYSEPLRLSIGAEHSIRKSHFAHCPNDIRVKCKVAWSFSKRFKYFCNNAQNRTNTVVYTVVKTLFCQQCY